MANVNVYESDGVGSKQRAGRAVVYDPGDRVVEVRAYGGTRRERGSAIGAAVRGRGLLLNHVRYSETYGFQTCTYAYYRRAV